VEQLGLKKEWCYAFETVLRLAIFRGHVNILIQSFWELGKNLLFGTGFDKE
jgi:hypothetical protein